MFHRDTAPDDVKRLFSQLVSWVGARGYGILDPQSGQPRDISLKFVPRTYQHEPCLMGQPGSWEIVVGPRETVASTTSSRSSKPVRASCTQGWDRERRVVLAVGDPVVGGAPGLASLTMMKPRGRRLQVRSVIVEHHARPRPPPPLRV